MAARSPVTALNRDRNGWTRNRWLRLAAGVVIAILLLIAPLELSPFSNQTVARIAVYAVAVLGLNVIMGYTGQVSLGQIFFVGLGAYVTAFGLNAGWNIVLVFVLSFVIPGVIGALVSLAAARLRGLAIAMVTVALPIVGVPLAKRLTDLTGGSEGTSAVFPAAPGWLGLADDQWMYYVCVIIAAAVFALAFNFVRGRYGRALALVKANEAVAASLGISPYRYKVLGFTIASIFGGISGFLYLAAISFTSPETMGFEHSIELVAATIIGGSGSIVGSLIGGIYYVLLPTITNNIDANATEIVQGVVVLVVLLLLPGGLASLPAVLRRTRRNPKNPGTTERHHS
jgi:branched-chain amino acid transport system permease protein